MPLTLEEREEIAGIFFEANLEKVEALFVESENAGRPVDVNEIFSEEYPIIYVLEAAIKKGNDDELELVKFLLNKGAKLDAVSPILNKNSLMVAIENRGLCKVLLNHIRTISDVEKFRIFSAKDEFEMNVFEMALNANNEDLLEELLSVGSASLKQESVDLLGRIMPMQNLLGLIYSQDDDVPAVHVSKVAKHLRGVVDSEIFDLEKKDIFLKSLRAIENGRPFAINNKEFQVVDLSYDNHQSFCIFEYWDGVTQRISYCDSDLLLSDTNSNNRGYGIVTYEASPRLTRALVKSDESFAKKIQDFHRNSAHEEEGEFIEISRKILVQEQDRENRSIRLANIALRFFLNEIDSTLTYQFDESSKPCGAGYELCEKYNNFIIQKCLDNLTKATQSEEFRNKKNPIYSIILGVVKNCFLRAAAKNDVELLSQLKKILKDDGVDTSLLKNSKGENALFISARFGNEQAFYWLLKEDKKNISILATFLIDVTNSELASEFILQIIEYLAKNRDGNALEIIEYLVASNRDDVIQILLNKGFDPNTKKDGTNFLLNLATYLEDLDLIKILLGSKNFDLDAKNKNGFSLLDWAIEALDKESESSSSKIIKYLEIIQSALARGAKLNIENKKDKDVLYWAILHKEAFAIELIDKHYDLDDLNKAHYQYGRTSLMFAAGLGEAKICKALLGKGVDVLTKDKVGFSALALAICNYKEVVAELLVESGGDLEEKDHYGFSYLERIAQNSQMDAFLKKHYNGNIETFKKAVLLKTILGLLYSQDDSGGLIDSNLEMLKRIVSEFSPELLPEKDEFLEIFEIIKNQRYEKEGKKIELVLLPYKGHGAYGFIKYENNIPEDFSICDGNLPFTKMDANGRGSGKIDFKIKYEIAKKFRHNLAQEVRRVFDNKDRPIYQFSEFYHKNLEYAISQIAECDVNGRPIASYNEDFLVKPQERGNCSMKAINMAMRVILHEVMGYEYSTSKKGDSINDVYKRYKDSVVKYSLSELVNLANSDEGRSSKSLTYTTILDAVKSSFLQAASKASDLENGRHNKSEELEIISQLGEILRREKIDLSELVNSKGENAIFIAAKKRNVAAFGWCLENEVNIRPNNLGESLLSIIVENDNVKTKDQNAEMLDLLRRNNPNISELIKSGEIELLVEKAVKIGNNDVVKFFINQGFDPDYKLKLANGEIGDSLITFAEIRGNLELVDFLRNELSGLPSQAPSKKADNIVTKLMPSTHLVGQDCS